jgi:hypothetical protein
MNRRRMGRRRLVAAWINLSGNGPVWIPRVWPKNLLSNSSLGMEAQLTRTSG